MLKRSPFFLRVTVDGRKVDALDQPDDAPTAREKLLAYELMEMSGTCHLYFGGGRGGFYNIAKYRLVADPPADAVMRDAAKWRSWCEQKSSVRPS